MHLNKEELRRFSDYYEWVDIDLNTLTNHIGGIILDKGYIYHSEKVEKKCQEYFKQKEQNENKLLEFILSLDIDELILKF